MALVVKSKINFQVLDNTITLFNTGDLQNTTQTLTKSFGADFIVANGVSDMEVCFEGASQANQLFLLSDQAVEIKLVSLGQTAVSTPSLMLYPNLPSLLSIQNLVGIYVSNNTGTDAKLLVEGAGA